MNHYYDDVKIPEKPIDLEEERKRTVEMLLKEEEGIKKGALSRVLSECGYVPMRR